MTLENLTNTSRSGQTSLRGTANVWASLPSREIEEAADDARSLTFEFGPFFVMAPDDLVLF